MTLHGAFANFEGTENVVNAAKIYEYEKLANRNLSIATFSQNWFEGIKFPLALAIRLKKIGVVPLIRIMPRSDFTEGRPDPKFSLKKIASGEFDDELATWGRDCHLFGSRVLVDFACEANGAWFPWSFEDAELYVQAFRKVQSSIKAWAPKTEFVWHVNYDRSREALAKYFPGDSYIDFAGASIYGNHGPHDTVTSFPEIADYTFDNLDSITSKPKVVSELGVTETKPGNKAKWITEAFDYIANRNRFAFVSWWHSEFSLDDSKETVNYRIDSSVEALEAYRQSVKNSIYR